MLIKIDARQLGALLAGLRLLQDHAHDGYDNPHILDVFSDGRAIEPLSVEEIEALCDGVNGGALSLDERDVSAIETQWCDRARLQGYVGERRLNLSVEFFVGALAARHAAGLDQWCPPRWLVAITSGQAIEEMEGG